MNWTQTETTTKTDLNKESYDILNENAYYFFLPVDLRKELTCGFYFY